LDADVVFLSIYPCPGCDVELEAPEAATTGWLRCPRCGRPSLPPADGVIHNRRRPPRARRDHPAGMSGAELLLTVPQHAGAPSSSAGLKAIALLVGVAVPVLVSIWFQRDLIEIVAVDSVAAIALLVLLRPRSRS
jgi:hypothetical protein